MLMRHCVWHACAHAGSAATAGGGYSSASIGDAGGGSVPALSPSTCSIFGCSAAAAAAVSIS